MNNAIINLVRLQYKVYGDETLNKHNIKSRLGFLVPIAVCILTMAGLLLYAVVTIGGYFVQEQLSMEYLEIIFFIVQAIQFIFGVSVVSKTLFGSENDDLLKLPVTGVEIFTAKIIYLYIHELMFSTALVLPTLIVYGFMYVKTATFFLMIIPVCLLFPMFPFVLALLVSVPAMILRNLLNNRFFLMLIGAIVSICICYVLYMIALELMLNLVFLNTTQIRLTDTAIASIENFVRYLLPQALLANQLFGQDIFQNAAIVLLSSFLAIVVVLICADKWYYRAFFKESESSSKLSTTKSHLAQGGVFIQLANREFVNIFRSLNYSFQFLALAASTPVMVFFCSRLSLNIGIGNVGELILPGLTVLVITMFIAVASSFSASAITREGNKLFHMKNIPVPIKMQITAKAFVYAMVAVISIVLSSLGLLIAGYVNFSLFAVIMTTCIFFALGGICNSIKRDVKAPAFRDVGLGEMVVTNNNTLASISIGLLTSVVVGVSVILMCYSNLVEISLYAMMAAGFVFAAFSVLRLYVGLDKCFERIEM